MYVLIIKGNEIDAIDESVTRGLLLLELRQVNDSEVRAYVGAGGREKVQAWYQDAPFHAPFKPGTLLWYRDLDDPTDERKEHRE